MEKNKAKLRKLSQAFGRFKSKGLNPKYIITDLENTNRDPQEYTTVLPGLETLLDNFDSTDKLKIQVVESSTNSVLESAIIEMNEEEEIEEEEETLNPEIEKRLATLERSSEKLIDAVTRILDQQQKPQNSNTDKLYELLEKKLNPMSEFETYKKMSEIFRERTPRDPNADTNARLSELLIKSVLERQSTEQTMSMVAEFLKNPVVGQLFASKSSPQLPVRLGGNEDEEMSQYLKSMNNAL